MTMGKEKGGGGGSILLTDLLVKNWLPSWCFYPVYIATERLFARHGCSNHAILESQAVQGNHSMGLIEAFCDESKWKGNGISFLSTVLFLTLPSTNIIMWFAEVLKNDAWRNIKKTKTKTETHSGLLCWVSLFLHFSTTLVFMSEPHWYWKPWDTKKKPSANDEPARGQVRKKPTRVK